jgi:hypothetical protein
MAHQEDHVQLLALALLNYADDEGYFYGDPRLVRSLRPFSTQQNIWADLLTLKECGWIELHKSRSHGWLGRIVNFSKHQNVNHARGSMIKPYWKARSLKPKLTLGEEEGKPKVSLSPGTGNREQGREQGTGNGTTPSEEGVGQPRSPKARPARRAGSPILVDEAFLERQKKIFRPEDVDRCYARMLAWLETPKGRGKPASQMRFLHFLRDAEPLQLEEEALPEKRMRAEVEGWRELLGQADPEMNLPPNWGELPDNLQLYARQLARAKKERGEAA